MKIKAIIACLSAALLFTACGCKPKEWADSVGAASAAASISTFTDPRDGKAYKTVKIAHQTWMAENLDYNKADSSLCYDYNDECRRIMFDRYRECEYNDVCDRIGFVRYTECDCKEYGRLYDWDAAMTACPSGWHLPSRKEWGALVEAAGGQKAAGKRLKSKTGWAGNNGINGNGNDDFGFSALPGGKIRERGESTDSEWYGYWWSATDSDRYGAYYREMINVSYYDGVNELYGSKKSSLSVRCVEDGDGA